MPAFRTAAPAIALVLLAAAGCTSDDGGPRFDAEGGRDVRCMVHQAEPPGSRYTEPERRNTAEVLTVLRYYTAHGRKPYCDGNGPTGTDREWIDLYVQQGADPANVRR